MNPTLTNRTRPASHRGLDLGKNANWQKDRVSFPHCESCITDRVRKLAEFGDNWDGYGAKPVTPAMIDAVCRFLERLADERGDLLLKPGTETECLVPYCLPMSSGAVQLEWHVEGRILEIEFERPGLIHYLKWWPGHEVADDEATFPADDLEQSAALIEWVFYGDAAR